MARRQKRKPGRRSKKRRVLPIFASGQRYACRDCPARCCRLPGRVRLIADDAERLAADPWAVERMGERGRLTVERGFLPVREEAGHAQCVFLDDDDLCGLQKEHDHAFLPRACRAFPFGFVRDESDVLRASASRLCPSIRDSYGEPAARQVDDKLEQLGVADRVSDGISVRGGKTLSRAKAVAAVEAWRSQLASSDEPLTNLARIHDEIVGDESPPIAHVRRPGYFGGMLIAHLLSYICYPSRVLSPDRLDAVPWYRLIGLRSFLLRLSCWLGWGSVDMLFVDGRVPMGQALDTAPPTSGELGAEIARYLCLTIDRRRILAQPRPLASVFLDLVLAAVIASRFACCRAAAGRRSVELSDVREGIGVADLLVVTHATPGAETGIVKRLRAILLAEPQRLRRLLSADSHIAE